MFWIHGEDLPKGVGSETFCGMHLAYLAFFLTLAVCLAFISRRLDDRHRTAVDRVLAALIIFFALCEYGVTALIGRFTRYTLPFHVCTLLFFLVPIHAWTNAASPGSFAARLHSFLGSALFHPGILGTLAALLFPDWLYYPFWNYVSISSFLAHGFLLVYGASILVRIARAPDTRERFLCDLGLSVLFMGIGGLVMALFDRATGTNYWFMAGPSNDSPFSGIYERSGYGGYLFAYALTALLITALWYGLRYCLLVRRRKP